MRTRKDRDKLIIQSTKKIKSLGKLHGFCEKIKSNEQRDELRSKIISEITITLLLLDDVLGAENMKRWLARLDKEKSG